MSSTVGPFTPTTETVLLDCQAGTPVGPINLTGLNTDGWPSTFICTNVGNAATYFNIGTAAYLSAISPSAGNFLLAGQTIVLTIESALAATNATPLIAATFGLGATNIAVTGGVNR